MDLEQAWKSVKGQLQMDMSRASFNTWVKDTNALAFEDGVMTVAVSNAYARDWLESRLSSTVTRLLTGIMNRQVSVEFVVEHAANAETAEQSTSDLSSVAEESQPAAPRVRNASLNPRYTFENFIVGSNNRLAHAAALSVSETPAQSYNPLFIYSGVGLGKTHLLHAIGNACTAKNLRVLYVTSEEFTNDMIQSIRQHTTQAFRDKYRSADVLLLDDIQFIAGKEGTQEEFFHTFNSLHGQGKQIVITSDRTPRSMPTLEERLRSRFEWGLLADIQSPDLETRNAILRSKAERMGKRVPAEIIDLIAKRVHTNIRELEGALNRVVAFSELAGVPYTTQLAEVALVDLLPQLVNITPSKLIALVAAEWQTTVEALTGKSRTKHIAEPRQVAMYLLRHETNASLPQIGEVLGGRDHTTIMYGIEKIQGEILVKKDVERKINKIKQQLHTQAAYA